MEWMPDALNNPQASRRLQALEACLPTTHDLPVGEDVNNHIHTSYSFSPYSPTAAAYMARRAGLSMAGIMDHDTIAGAREFLQAAHMLGIGGTCGVETRVSFAGTPLEGRRINNPDQADSAYVLLHGVPHNQIETVDAFFAPLREQRNIRNRRMTEAIGVLVAGSGIQLNFDRDVLPLSEAAHGGSVTERHLASALAFALEAKAGRGQSLIAFLEQVFDIPVGAKYRALFDAPENPFFHYDLIGWIKAEVVPLFYIPAEAESAPVRELLALGERVGAITAYAYLGDVAESVTGDKRPQTFEDAYLEELFEVIVGLGFRAVTYMPARNTRAQLERVRALIARYGLFEISGEDINQPRQAFVSEAMRDPWFHALRDSAWAMIAHERESEGLFSESAIRNEPDLGQRVKAFAMRGKRLV